MPPTPKPQKPPDPPGTPWYRFIGNRAMILEGGQPIEPGQYIQLTPEEITGVTQLAVLDGHLIDATGSEPQMAQESAPPPEEGE